MRHYKIHSKLGEGGMGEVCRTNDSKLNREVAIEVLPEAFAAAVSERLRTLFEVGGVEGILVTYASVEEAQLRLASQAAAN